MRKDCRVTTGAIMIPMARESAIREAFDALDVPMDMIELTGRMRYRLPHGDYDQASSGGGLRGLIGFAFPDDEDGAERLYREFIDAIKSIPAGDETIRGLAGPQDGQPERQDAVPGLLRGVDGINLHEIAADQFFLFLANSSRRQSIRHGGQRNGELMEALAREIEKRGSRVLRSTTCREIRIENGLVSGVRVTSRARGEEYFRKRIV